jgi:hypothetical protein
VTVATKVLPAPSNTWRGQEIALLLPTYIRFVAGFTATLFSLLPAPKAVTMPSVAPSITETLV